MSSLSVTEWMTMGYDVSDYYQIATEFGTIEEFKELLTEAKKRGIKIIMDLVFKSYK